MVTSGCVGVDEAGRGPLAGPVAVGVVYVPPDVDIRTIRGIKDSKQMTERERAVVYERIAFSGVRYAVAMVGASYIDRHGIQQAIRVALARAMRKLSIPSHTNILLDGGLRAPESYVNQKTIIKGDARELAIGAASIMAKVTRDRYMKKQHVLFPVYGFDVQKGYGTVRHRAAIREYGLSPLHRRSFCSRIV